MSALMGRLWSQERHYTAVSLACVISQARSITTRPLGRDVSVSHKQAPARRLLGVEI